jgi:hypothetical protein
MTKISNYITLEEACKSETAIRKGIDNIPTEEEIKAIKLICEKVYDLLCEKFEIKIPFASFFRSVKLNKAIGGSSSSQHCKGEAVDLDLDSIPNISNKELFDYIKSEESGIIFDQLIWEFGDDKNPAWVHVSYSAVKNRMMILKAVKINGKTKYIKWD